MDETGLEPVLPRLQRGALPIGAIHPNADKERFELSTMALTGPRSAVELSIRLLFTCWLMKSRTSITVFVARRSYPLNYKPIIHYQNIQGYNSKRVAFFACSNLVELQVDLSTRPDLNRQPSAPEVSLLYDTCLLRPQDSNLYLLPYESSVLPLN